MIRDRFDPILSEGPGPLMPAFTPALIMFVITVLLVTMFFLPATYERKSPVVNFYWVGLWMFLGLILCIAGAEQVVILLGLDTTHLPDRLLTATTLCFVLFIMAGWARLSGLAVLKAITITKDKADR